MCLYKSKEHTLRTYTKTLVWSKDGHGNNIFVDMSSSLKRRNKPECCVDASTCITPSHGIYSVGLGRYVQAVEMLGLQAMWRADQEKPEVWDRMAYSNWTQDLAGNGMTGTVAQAVFLSALASSDAFLKFSFHHADPGAMNAGSSATTSRGSASASASSFVVQEGGNPSNPKQPTRGIKRKQPNQLVLAEDDGELPVPTKRLRGKQTVLKIPKPKPIRGLGAGNKEASGKKKMVSIFDKEAICKAFDKAVADGAKNPQKVVKKQNLHGFYAGCMYASKWGSVRQEQQWTLLCDTAPKLCKSFKELPNSLRRVINFPTLKHGSKPEKSETRTMLPMVLQEVANDVIMERIDQGEEVGITFIQNTLIWLAGIWNDCVGTIREMIQSRNLEMLSEQDEELSKMPAEELDKLFQSVTARADEILVPITLNKSDAALMSLGIQENYYEDVLSESPLHLDMIYFIYIYIHRNMHIYGIL